MSFLEALGLFVLVYCALGLIDAVLIYLITLNAAPDHARLLARAMLLPPGLIILIALWPLFAYFIIFRFDIFMDRVSSDIVSHIGGSSQ